MVRSLWSAATGMIAQQTNLDTIANNLANVNSTGYKTEVAEFKSLLYQTMQTETTTANGANKPISAQVSVYETLQLLRCLSRVRFLHRNPIRLSQ